MSRMETKVHSSHHRIVKFPAKIKTYSRLAPQNAPLLHMVPLQQCSHNTKSPLSSRRPITDGGTYVNLGLGVTVASLSRRPITDGGSVIWLPPGEGPLRPLNFEHA